MGLSTRVAKAAVSSSSRGKRGPAASVATSSASTVTGSADETPALRRSQRQRRPSPPVIIQASPHPASKPRTVPKAESELTDVLLVPDAAAWRAWLDVNEATSDGVWLVIAKRGTTAPTSLSFEAALHEALCSGWINGQGRRRDDATVFSRYTPRRKRSLWSARNVGLVARLEAEGRMRLRGQTEVELAKADGRWERAYAGPATAEIPDDLVAALDARPKAKAAFAKLGSQARYTVLFALMTASTPALREKRLASAVAKLGQVT